MGNPSASPDELHELLRQARKAVAREDYAEAEFCYALVMQDEVMQQDIDLKMRHAFCAEKVGKTELALQYYQEIVVTYSERGETGATELLEQKIAALYATAEQSVHADLPEAETEKLSQHDDILPLTDAQLLQELEKMGAPESLFPSEILCVAEGVADTIWLVKQGSIDILLQSQQQSIEPLPGELLLIGDLGLFTKQRHEATLIAHSEVELTSIAIDEILQRRQHDKLFDVSMERMFREQWVMSVLKQHPIFELVNDADCKRLAHSFQRITLNKGEVLLSSELEHAGAYIVQSGCLSLQYDDMMMSYETGDEHMMTHINPGDFIHLNGLLREYVSNYQISTASSVELLFLPRETFEVFVQNRPWLIQAILNCSRRPAHLQIKQPQNNHFLKGNKAIQFHKVKS